ncbi:MAG TPA: hypothetical protein QF753_17625 [Victivallales bacterium]|nr:hypothetical protein [Victivallales bacterium]
MKIFNKFIFIFFIFTTVAYAKSKQPETIGWSALQLGILPSYPQLIDYTNTYGFKFGIPMSSGYGKVGGLEASIFSSGTDNIYGMQLSPVNYTKNIYGFQTGAVNFVEEHVYGVQASFANITDIKTDGFQAGIYNYSKILNGVQLGVINISDRDGFQFGLINIMKNGWFPFSIIFNFRE